MTWSSADMRKAKLSQQAPDGNLVEIDIEPLLDDAFEIDAAPAHDAIRVIQRTAPDRC